MFEFVNKIFKNKQMTEEKKLSIIELVKNEESFINSKRSHRRAVRSKKS